MAGTARSTGKDIQILEQETELLSVCRSTLAATSSCIAAAVFFSSPHEGPDGKWNYSIRADGALERKIVVTSDKNDVEIYALPLQHAIDFAIAGLNTTIDRAVLPDEVMEYSFTSLTVQERKDKIRVRYMTAIIEILGVAFFIGMVGVEYQLTGLVAHEREIGMAQLLDCMMSNRARWQPQMVRIVANHLALDMIYLPGWVIIAIILKVGVFSKTSVGILIVFHVLSGLSLSSLSILVASLFRRAQMSGITATIVCLLLGIIAQISAKASTGAVTILCLLFPPMNYVYFTILIARWEKQDRGANIVKSAPDSPSALPGIVHWIFLVMQIFTLPLLGALIERSLYGTASRDRTITRSSESATALSLEGFTKEYRPNFFYRNIAPLFGNRKQLVMAADSLTFSAVKGQILVLLGANGSGKSTTLDAIAGLTQITSGSIHVNYAGPTGGLGLCPQKNVLWDELTVEEHVKIFNRIKSLDTVDSTAQVQSLIAACDIDSKIKARSKTLSGGQRRKLQLAMTFTGGSSMCLIDEVSSGLDPLSRRKIWDILLAERGSRTLLLTTHFLDEAELLSDSITILSKGKLRANGTAVELKHKLGAGYRVHIYNLPGASAPQYEGIPREVLFDQTVYSIQNSAQVAQFVARLESEGIHEYQVSGTTIEDVFLKVAEEVQTSPTEVIQTESTRAYDSKDCRTTFTERPLHDHPGPQLITGRRIGMPRQAWVLFCKRATVLRRNYLPYAAAFLIPVVAAGLVTLFLKDFRKAGCSPSETISISDISSLVSQKTYNLVAGPSNRLSRNSLLQYAQTLSGGGGAESGVANFTGLLQSIYLVDTLDDFNRYIDNHYVNVTPGGFFLGQGSQRATFAWRGDGDISFATITQNALNVLLTNISISSQYV